MKLLNKKINLVLVPAIVFLSVFVIYLGMTRRVDMFGGLNSTAKFNAAVRKNPNLLNGQTIVGKDLTSHNPDRSDRVILENLTIHNLTLKDCEFRNAILRNVTFINCRFIKTSFAGSIFEDVRFLGGEMRGYDAPKTHYADYETYIGGTIIGRILFEGVQFGKSTRLQFDYGGIVVIRSMVAKDKRDNGYPSLLTGNNLQVRMDNCKVSGQMALNLSGENNTVYITNSSFAWSDLRVRHGTMGWIENSSVSGDLPNMDVLVLKNCRVTAGNIWGKKTGNKIFLADNEYFSIGKRENWSPNGITLRIFTVSRGNPDSSYLYLYGRPGHKIPGEIILGPGKIHIFDTEIEFGSVSMPEQATLNLSNVTLHDFDWQEADIQGGAWNKVNIYPVQNLENAKLQNIQGYHVEYPAGNPWKNGTVEIGYNTEPLKIEKPPVPTLEELGLAQFWKENDFPPQEY